MTEITKRLRHWAASAKEKSCRHCCLSCEYFDLCRAEAKERKDEIMKIKEVVKLCMESGALIFLYSEDGMQMISNGSGIYPLYGVPELDQDSIQQLYGIKDKKMEEVQVKHMPLPEGYNFADMDESECAGDKLCLHFDFLGNRYAAIKTMHGISFVNEKYLKPLGDLDNVELYERQTTAGRTYFVAKVGMMAKAFLHVVENPPKKLTEEFEEVCTRLLQIQAAQAEEDKEIMLV